MTPSVEMWIQGRNDFYRGLYCLSTAARLFGLSGRLRSEWSDTADKKAGIGRLKRVEMAQEIGLVATRGRWWRIRDITDIQPNSVWLACIWRAAGLGARPTGQQVRADEHAPNNRRRRRAPLESAVAALIDFASLPSGRLQDDISIVLCRHIGAPRE
jgi:hypothetical protein